MSPPLQVTRSGPDMSTAVITPLFTKCQQCDVILNGEDAGLITSNYPDHMLYGKMHLSSDTQLLSSKARFRSKLVSALTSTCGAQFHPSWPQ